MFNFFYKNKKVLVTGANGFKGTWLCLWLNLLGAKVYGFGLKKNSYIFSKNISLDKIIKFQEIDIRNKLLLKRYIRNIKPEIIFHLAGQPLVIAAYNDPVETFEINGNGTLNMLEVSNTTKSVKCLVSVTSDKAYQNMNKNKAYKEDDRIFGDDPYSASKSVADIIINSYQKTLKRNDLAIVSVRAGNVIGGGDFSKNRIVPDIVRSILKKKDIILRNPLATRPWQFVLDPLHGYLILAEEGYKNKPNCTGAYNFGPSTSSEFNVLNVCKFFINSWKKNIIKIKIQKSKVKEHGKLALSISKAKKNLNWKPVYNTKQSLEKTAFWFKSSSENKLNMLNTTYAQIRDFSNHTNYVVNHASNKKN